MAVSKTSIINKALTQCGAAPITNITDDTNNARVVNRVYEIARLSLLGECCWTFATTRCTLSLSAETMPWEYDDEAFVYVRPSTVVRIFDVSDPDAVWREEGDYIISDTGGLGLKYVYDLDDPAKYSPSFVEALIDKLCSDISYMIVNNPKLAEGFLLRYEKVSLPRAKSENSQTGTQQVSKDNDWINAKWANGRPDRSFS
jgi:hypothetical protein